MDTINQESLMTTESVYWIEMAEALAKLENDPNFKKVILEGYFREKAVDGVSLLATEYVKRNGLRTDVMESLIAISQLEDYFNTIRNLGASAKQDAEDALEEELEG